MFQEKFHELNRHICETLNGGVDNRSSLIQITKKKKIVKLKKLKIKI